MTEEAGGARRRIGIFGGTFDPFHCGHLVAAQDALEELGLERVWFIPAGDPPHKGREDTSDSSVRLEMTREGTWDDARFEVLDLEVGRPGPSYTVDTLRALRKSQPEGDFFLLLGADQWRTFGSWRDPREIARLATLAVMTREGEQPGKSMRGHEPLLPADFRQVAVTRFDVSSTQLRERVRSGRSIRYLVPDRVRRIIEAAGLYI
ncbi:MAG: nicotinate-nucleotide adenylyltransferase [Gemmatimonadota bacterium]